MIDAVTPGSYAGRRALPAVCCVLLITLAPLSAATAPQEGSAPDSPVPVDSTLSREVQATLAQTLAPALVFHALEEYFPVSPLFTLQDDHAGTPGLDEPTLLARIGTAKSRRDRYRALSLQEKAALATVYYRVYQVRRHSKDAVVVEYWFYYVHDDYRIRGNLFPFWFDTSHPNDLEHLHIILRQGADSQYYLDEVYASAHLGEMPANRYRYGAVDLQKRGRYLVERGSHALAPDIDEDGVFTPGRDGDSGQKLLWGIRDRGLIWPRYKRSYMDDRRVGPSRVFEYAGAPPSAGSMSYRLVPVEELSRSFAGLGLSSKQRKALFEADTSWFRRAFGSDNGSSTELLVPPEHQPGSPSIGIDSFASTERGFLLGATVKADRLGVLFGARYAFLHGIRYLPDVFFEADGHVNTLSQAYVSGEATLSYPIDGTMRVFFGGAIVTDLTEIGRHQVDWVAGIEFRLGRMRINASSRSSGPVTQSSKEFSLSYLF